MIVWQALGPGCQYVMDDNGDYALDEYGGAVVQDADGVVIAPGIPGYDRTGRTDGRDGRPC